MIPIMKMATMPLHQILLCLFRKRSCGIARKSVLLPGGSATLLLSMDHIVMGRKRMRLVAMQQHAGMPAGKREFFAVPVYAEGNDVIAKEASADRRRSKRKKVRCFETLVTVLDGPRRRGEV